MLKINTVKVSYNVTENIKGIETEKIIAYRVSATRKTSTLTLTAQSTSKGAFMLLPSLSRKARNTILLCQDLWLKTRWDQTQT